MRTHGVFKTPLFWGGGRPLTCVRRGGTENHHVWADHATAALRAHTLRRLMHAKVCSQPSEASAVRRRHCGSKKDGRQGPWPVFHRADWELFLQLKTVVWVPAPGFFLRLQQASCQGFKLCVLPHTVEQSATFEALAQSATVRGLSPATHAPATHLSPQLRTSGSAPGRLPSGASSGSSKWQRCQQWGQQPVAAAVRAPSSIETAPNVSGRHKPSSPRAPRRSNERRRCYPSARLDSGVKSRRSYNYHTHSCGTTYTDIQIHVSGSVTSW